MNRHVLVMCLATAVAGCSGGGVDCPAICGGCCQSDGRCAPGTLQSACGTAGVTCSVCSAAQTCAQGFCVSGAGGGGGSGGGSGTAGGGSTMFNGNVTFLWSFGGTNCAAAGVSTVRITIPGQSLQNSGVFPCETNGTAGIVLLAFAPGSYTFTIEGRNGAGTVTWSAPSAQFTVNGDVTVPVNLSASANTVALKWAFPPNTASSNPTCAQAGVDTVEVSIDSTTPYSVLCSNGQTVTGAPSPVLSVGTHSIRLRGLNATGYAYYEKTGALGVTGGPGQMTTYLFDWAVGGVALSWSLSDTGVITTCGAAGVSTVYVNFRDASMAFVYPGAGDPQPCSAAQVQYSFLTPGTYAVFLQGTGAGGTAWSSSVTSPPAVTVSAGTFPSTGPNVLLVRQ